MVFLYATILLILNIAWLAIVPFSMPGNWLIVVSTAFFAWFTREQAIISMWFVVFITLVALLGEIIEFFAGMGGAKKAGAGFWGSLAAIVGAITGAIVGTVYIPIPLFGTIIGSCCGAGIGTWTVELAGGKAHHHAIKTGVGAGLGQLIGITSKFILGVFICVFVFIALLWP